MAPSASSSANAPSVTTISQSPPLLVKKLSSSAKAPTRGSAFAAGYDVYASKDTSVPKRGKELVDTDIAIAVPEGTCEPYLLFTGLSGRGPRDDEAHELIGC